MNSIQIAETIWELQNLSIFDIADIKISDDERTNEAFRNMLDKWQEDLFTLECFYRKQKKFEDIKTLFPRPIFIPTLSTKWTRQNAS